jgi:hypothetical protein
MNRPIFTTITLSNGIRVKVYDGNAGDLMDAMIESNGNTALAMYGLMTKLCTFDDKPIFNDDLRKISMQDLTAIGDCIGAMMAV